MTATVINVGTESSPSYQLVLSGDDTGTDFAIQNLTVAGVGLTGQANVSPASNAQVVVDGITVQRSTNVFADVLPGVSFTVTSESDGLGGPASTSFTIDTDLEGVKENVQGFVDAYNEVMDFINQQNVFDVDEGTTGGDLFGDTSLQSVRSALTRALFGGDRDSIVQGTLPTSEFQIGFESLGLVGIDLQPDGTLQLDETTLDEKLAEDLDAFVQLFSNDFAVADPSAPTADAENFQGDGLLLRLDSVLEDLLADTTVPDPSDPTQSIGVDGLFNNRRNAINASIRNIDDQIERLEFHIEQREITLVQQFTRLEELIGQLNSQQAFLANNLQ